MSSLTGNAAHNLAEYRKRDSREGRFLRYARARVQQFLPRQILTVFGSAVTAVYVDLYIGALALALALFGEVVDYVTLRGLIFMGPKVFKRRWADRLAAVSAMFQATCFSVCIGMGWILGGIDAHMFALSFFLAAGLNGGLTANFHLLSSIGWSLVYATAVIILLVLSSMALGVSNTGWQLTVFASLMLVATSTIFLRYLLGLQRRYMEMTGDMLAQNRNIEDALQTKTKFLSSVSHQLRTPLNGIIGASELLAASNPTKEQSALLQPLRSSTSDLHALVSDILDITQLEKGGFLITRRAINLRRVFEDIVERYRQRAVSKGLNFDLEISGNLPDSILADPDRIRQVLSKLLANAVQFTQEGVIKVTASVSQSGVQSFVFITVEDTGPGMSKSQIKRLFSHDPLQADALDNGLGISLRISQKLARQMGGNLLIESAVGQGTKCRLTIELYPVETASPVEHDWDITKASILIAEDNKTNQLIVRKMLDRTGANLCFAADGEEAVEQYHSFHPDLILMDLAMPKKTGLEATEAIRAYERKSQAKETPIIALTANAFDEDKRNCERAGMNGFLSKPVNREALIKELTRAGQEAMT